MKFEHMFEPHILDRGYGYKVNGQVSVVSINKNEVKAIVYGSKSYEVELVLDEFSINHMYCDCPHFHDGHNCKHLAAVLYKLGDSADEEFDMSSVEQLSESEAKKFIIDMMMENSHVKEAFILRFSQKEIDTLKYESAFRESIFRFHDFVNGYDVDEFAIEIDNYLNVITKFVKNKLYRKAFTLIKTLIEEIRYLEIDDYNGETSYLYENLMNLLISILENSDDTFKLEIFQYIVNYRVDYGQGDIDCLMDDLYSCQFINEPFLDMKLELIEKEIRESDNDSMAYLILEKSNLLMLKGVSVEECITLLIPFELNEYVRMRIIDFKFESHQYNQLESYIKHQNIIPKYRVRLLLVRLFQLTNNIIKLKAIRREILLYHGYYDDYLTYRELFLPAEWLSEKNSLMPEIKELSCIDKIYHNENMTVELLELVLKSEDFNLLNKYKDTLVVEYNEIVLELYRKLFLAHTDKVNSRSQYNTLIHQLAHLLPLEGGQLLAEELIIYWYRTQTRRKAFLDEMSKFRKKYQI